MGDYNVDSDGKPLDSSITFDLGYFSNQANGSVFDPRQESVDLWSDHWVPFDRSAYSDQFSFFTGAATLLDDFTSTSMRLSASEQQANYLVGAQAYIWGYDSQESSAESEWLLVTNSGVDGDASDDWVFPTPSTHAVPLSWRTPDATEAIFGAAGDQFGDGEVANFDEDANLQTFTLGPQPIPEPSSTLLTLLGACFLLGKRRRP